MKNLPPERIFNLIGTNSRDYSAAGGISAWAAGDASDGLVRIENATNRRHHVVTAPGTQIKAARGCFANGARARERHRRREP